MPMKRIFTLTLALLMTVLLSAGAAHADADLSEPSSIYVGTWEIVGQQDGEAYTSLEDADTKLFLIFLPNGAIQAVMVSGADAKVDYLAYEVTGENSLDIYEGEDPLPGVYDPATETITVTDTNSDRKTFVRRFAGDSLPDVSTLLDASKEEQKYYAYQLTNDGQTINLLSSMSIIDIDVYDFYLTLNPDGTGYLQFGSEEAGGEITWDDTSFTAEGESVPYTRVKDHILLDLGGQTVEFAPEGEVEALLAVIKAKAPGADKPEPVAAKIAMDPAMVPGDWKLVKATAAGQTLSAELLKQQGLEMSFSFNADGTASMISNGTTTPGLQWTLKGDTIVMTVYSYELPYKLVYDGEYLTLDYMAMLYFGKDN